MVILYIQEDIKNLCYKLLFLYIVMLGWGKRKQVQTKIERKNSSILVGKFNFYSKCIVFLDILTPTSSYFKIQWELGFIGIR